MLTVIFENKQFKECIAHGIIVRFFCSSTGIVIVPILLSTEHINSYNHKHHTPHEPSHPHSQNDMKSADIWICIPTSDFCRYIWQAGQRTGEMLGRPWGNQGDVLVAFLATNVAAA